MYEDLNNKVVLVTGGSKGIGKSIVSRFLKEKSIVYSVSRHAPEIREDNVNYMFGDVSNSEDAKNIIKKIVDENGKIDILINNAGIEEYASLENTELNMWERTININLNGAYLMSKYALKYMVENNYGNIINMSSVQSNIITKNAAAYVTSKHAIIGLTKSIALDYAPIIRCNAVCPATIDTPLVRRAAVLEVGNDENKINNKIKEWGDNHPMKRVGKPEEVANAVAFLASEESSFITGISLFVDGGLSIKAPISTPEK